MKYLCQFAIIATITFLGEVLNIILPFPVPASVYGMVLLFLALLFRVIKTEQVEETADFFVGIMPVFFIAPAVGMMETLPKIKGELFPVLVITIITTVLTMAITGLTAQGVIRLKKEGKTSDE